MVDGRRQARLAQEPTAVFGRARNLVLDHLECDQAPKRTLGSLVDDAHAAASGDRDDLVVAKDLSKAKVRGDRLVLHCLPLHGLVLDVPVEALDGYSNHTR